MRRERGEQGRRRGEVTREGQDKKRKEEEEIKG